MFFSLQGVEKGATFNREEEQLYSRPSFVLLGFQKQGSSEKKFLQMILISSEGKLEQQLLIIKEVNRAMLKNKAGGRPNALQPLKISISCCY